MFCVLVEVIRYRFIYDDFLVSAWSEIGLGCLSILRTLCFESCKRAFVLAWFRVLPYLVAGLDSVLSSDSFSENYHFLSLITHLYWWGLACEIMDSFTFLVIGIPFCKVMDSVKIVAVTPAMPVALWQNKWNFYHGGFNQGVQNSTAVPLYLRVMRCLG